MNIIAFPNSPYRLHQPFEPAGDQPMAITQLVEGITEMQYERNDVDFQCGNFRVRGDVIGIFPAENSEHALRLSLFDPLKGDRVMKENLVNYSCQARSFVEISPAI